MEYTVSGAPAKRSGSPNLYRHLTDKQPCKTHVDLIGHISHQSQCLGGRATAVFGSSCPDAVAYDNLGYKTSFFARSKACPNEGKRIEGLLEDIQSNDKSKRWRYGTHKIQSMFWLHKNGCRTLRISVSKPLLPFTTLVGADFVKAWLEVVNFHAFLWHIGIEHGDPSLWNVMYNDTLKCGVLCDYDLTILQSTPRIPGTDITRSIPFMAVDILITEYWHGETARVYRHELEAFIWILPFVFLRYQDGKSQHGTLVEKWMTPDYVACSESKASFLCLSRLRTKEKLCQAAYKDHWPLSEGLLYWLTKLDHIIYSQYRGSSPHEDMDSVAAVWPLFIQELKKIVIQASPDYMTRLIEELKLDSTLKLGAALDSLDFSESDLDSES